VPRPTRHAVAAPQAETEEIWREEGARDLAHWLSIRYGFSGWKAHRWIAASHALEALPLLSEAFGSGELGVDKVLELCRFARPETERRLLRWAQTVSVAAVRRRADREVRTSTQAEIDAHEARFLSWWYTDEGRRMGLQAELPAAHGAVVVKAIERMTEHVPQMQAKSTRGPFPLAAPMRWWRSAREPLPPIPTPTAPPSWSMLLSKRCSEAQLAPSSRTARRCTPTPCVVCFAAGESKRSLRTPPATLPRLVGRTAIPPRGWCARCATATGSADSRVVGHGPSPSPITCAGGATVGAPISRTSSCSVRSITDWSTSSGGGCSGCPTAPTDGADPTGPAIVLDRRRVGHAIPKKVSWWPGSRVT